MSYSPFIQPQAWTNVERGREGPRVCRVVGCLGTTGASAPVSARRSPGHLGSRGQARARWLATRTDRTWDGRNVRGWGEGGSALCRQGRILSLTVHRTGRRTRLGPVSGSGRGHLVTPSFRRTGFLVRNLNILSKKPNFWVEKGNFRSRNFVTLVETLRRLLF